MIIDWKKQCEKIDATHLLSRDDPSDNKIYFRQEIVYVRSLIKAGKTFDECKEAWLNIQNGTAKQFSVDKEELDTQFYRTYLKARSKGSGFADCDREIEPIRIYEGEIQKINSLQCNKWIKEYFLILLAYYKFMHQFTERIEYSPTLVNWALRQVEYGSYKFRSYRDARQHITKAMNAARFKVIKFTPIKGQERYTTYIMPFSHESAGYHTVDSLDDISRLFVLFRDEVRVCPICGVQFPVTTKTKRNLCKLCYTKFRREYKTAKDREYYYRDK